MFKHTMRASAAAALLAGCAAISDEPARTASKATETESLPTYHLTEVELTAYSAEKEEQARKKQRDEYIRKNFVSITENFHAFKDRLYSQDKVGGIGVDLATLAASTVGTFASGTQTLQHISAGVAGLTGARSAVEKRALMDQTVAALVDKMMAERAKIELRLFEGIAAPTTDYTLLAAYRDIRAYYEAGTIKGAVAALTEEAANSRKTGEAKVDAKTLEFGLDPAARRIRTRICPDETCSEFSPGAVEQIRACIGGLDTPNLEITDLLFDKVNAKSRKKVALCLAGA